MQSVQTRIRWHEKRFLAIEGTFCTCMVCGIFRHNACHISVCFEGHQTSNCISADMQTISLGHPKNDVADRPRIGGTPSPLLWRHSSYVSHGPGSTVHQYLNILRRRPRISWGLACLFAVHTSSVIDCVSFCSSRTYSPNAGDKSLVCEFK
jgi:hypothetical protein